MTGFGSTGGLRDLARPQEREDASGARDGEASAALWAALAQKVSVAQVPLLSLEEMPSAWRASGGVLTPEAATTVAASSDAPEGSAAERLVVRVDGGELGELEVTVDRERGALRVTIGLENEQLARSVTLGSQGLRAALERAGMSVLSLNIVPASEVGTVLAQHRTSPSGPRPEPPKSGTEQDPDATRKRAHKRLTLIG